MVIMDYAHEYELRHYLHMWKAQEDVYLLHSDIQRLEAANLSPSDIKEHILHTLADSDAVLVMAGEWVNDEAHNAHEIGEINWQNYAIKQALKLGLKMRGIKLFKECEKPIVLKNKRGLKWRVLSSNNYAIALNELVT